MRISDWSSDVCSFDLKGFARISYDEWLERGTDAWVARLAVPVHLQRAQSAAVSNSAIGRQSVGYSQADLRPHVISIGNDGRLRATGRFGPSAQDVRNLVRDHLREALEVWNTTSHLLYAHAALRPDKHA